MMWRRCVAVLMLCAWQACSAEQLVNLMAPQVSSYAPSAFHSREWGWQLFDHDKSTYLAVRIAKVILWHGSEIRPTKYRITMAAHATTADYPTGVRVNLRGGVIDKVRDPVFQNGVYEGDLNLDYSYCSERGRYCGLSLIRFMFRGPNPYLIAEIELLGPPKALNILWPYGKYPCSQRLAVITTKQGPKQVFSRSKYEVAHEDLRRVFAPERSYRGTSEPYFHFDGAKPVIIGAKLPKLRMVREVQLGTTRLYHKYGVREIVLEGHVCQPRCSKYGSKGWVKLAAEKTSEIRYRDRSPPRVFVENPGKYKAYRIKFVPRTYQSGRLRSPSFRLWGLYFLGCTA